MNRSKIDLVLINPNSREEVYQSLGKDLSAVEPPVWAALMATFVRQKGFSVALIDAEAEQLTTAQVAQQVIAFNPRLVTIVVYGHQPSASTQNMTAAGSVATVLKELAPDLLILLVGGHVAALPEQTLREEKADFVSSGEGLHTITCLLQGLKDGYPNFAAIPDLWYRDGAAIQRSKISAPLVKDLNGEMPGLAWDLLPMKRYRAHNWHCLGHLQRQPYAALYTTLGCPYHCSFCCIQAPFKSGEQQMGYKSVVNSYRFWSPQCVVLELEMLVDRYGVRNIKFADEMFVLNPSHVEGICDLLIEKKLGLNIWAYARVDTVRENMVEKLKLAGFNWLAFGIEAANERVRKDVEKGFCQEDIFKTIDRIRKAGINVIGNYIFGLPEDDHETMQQTLELAIELNCEFANFYCAMAYPGSQLYTLALREGWPLPKTWVGYSQHSPETLPLPTRHLSAAEVLRFRDQAFQTYFRNPRYLEMIRKKFGEHTVAHISEMLSHPLRRKYA